MNKIKNITFVSPYARYLAILPLAEKQRLAELAQAEKESRKRKLCPDRIEEPPVEVSVECYQFLIFHHIVL